MKPSIILKNPFVCPFCKEELYMVITERLVNVYKIYENGTIDIKSEVKGIDPEFEEFMQCYKCRRTFDCYAEIDESNNEIYGIDKDSIKRIVEKKRKSIKGKIIRVDDNPFYS